MNWFQGKNLYRDLIPSALRPSFPHSPAVLLKTRQHQRLEQHVAHDVIAMRHDKVFSSAFVSERHLMYGTKDGGVFMLDVDSPAVPIPVETSTGPVHLLSASPCKTRVAVGSRNCVKVLDTVSFETVHTLVGQTDFDFAGVWLNGESIATAGRDATLRLYRVPADSSVPVPVTYSPQTPTQSRLPPCVARASIVASPSMLWSTTASPASSAGIGALSPGESDDLDVGQPPARNPPPEPTQPATQPAQETVGVVNPTLTITDHEQKIRCMSRQSEARVATVTPESGTTVRLWDVTRPAGLERTIILPHSCDTVAAVPLGHSTVALGSVAGVSVLDLRSANPAAFVAISHDKGWGVRSLAFNSPHLTVGGGAGSISTLDVRTGKYLTNEPQWIYKGRVESPDGMWLTMDMPVGVLTMSWSPAHHVLFAAGGPLQIGVTGACASVYN